ncbi:MAG: bifunctional diaminohydroxyphosphoribosylaminopyrimidine deaminase/5-amino-6-(5-phosphoribosylamino)uracil reductase RibD [Actinomycetota bacterium]
MSDDERYMQMALDLAASAPFSSPNPKVGAVIVKDGTVLSRGIHRGPATDHAEIVALNGTDPTGATCYVNLEPCTHEGRTPPCVPTLVASGISRVVAALEDPDARVRGRGLAYLEEHGVVVTVGVLAEQARRLNAPYLHHRMTGRSFLVLKLALTLDGRLSEPDRTWLTGPAARRIVHERRAAADAVMVGAGTIAADDPLLTARDVDAMRQPLRIVVDSSGRTPPSAAAFGGEAETLVATTERAPHEALIGWKEAGAEVVVLGRRSEGVDLEELLTTLGARGVLEVYCEGGAGLAESLLNGSLVNRLELHYAPLLVGPGGPSFVGPAVTDRPREWRTLSVDRAGNDVLVTLEPV